MRIHPVLRQVYHGLIVSCQADPGDPLRHPDIMAAIARAAVLGGAAGIRASGVEDIAAIRAVVDRPIIGIYKADIPGFNVRITPTLELALKISDSGADMIALDATNRPRPGPLAAAELIVAVKAETGKAVLADVSTLEEGIQAAQAGADAVLPTLAGYTEYSRAQKGPDFDLIAQLVRVLDVPVIAEGRIATPTEALHALTLGAWAVCVGSAITRPRWITARFVDGLKFSPSA